MPVVFRFMNLKTFQCLRAFFVTYLDAFADKEFNFRKDELVFDKFIDIVLSFFEETI